MELRAVFLGLFLISTLGTTKAATISVLPFGDTGLTLVVVSGQIVLSDAETFRQKVAMIPKAVVALQSDGGSTIAAIQIGTLIRTRNFSTLVVDKNRCASACALAWLGGTLRFMGTNALIGFHATYNSETGQESAPGNALVGAYLSRIGLSDAAVFYITRTPSRSMMWLNRDDAKKVGIDFALLDRQMPADPNIDPRQTEMPDRAKKYVVMMYQVMSKSPEVFSRTLSGIYADTVRYYGTDMSREQVVTRAQHFLARWPIRQYQAEEDSVTANCDDATLTCIVKGRMLFDARSPERNERSTGKANFEYLLRFAPNGRTVQILAEGGSVLERNKQYIAPRTDSPFWSALDQE